MSLQANRENYIELAIRTAPPKQAVDFQQSRLLLGAIGMVGEIGEVFGVTVPFIDRDRRYIDTKSLVKELGDVCWYAAAICDIKGFDLHDMLLSDKAALACADGVTRIHTERIALDSLCKKLLKHGSGVSEIIKKEVFHRHPVTPERDEQLWSELHRVFVNVQKIAAMFSKTIDNIFDENIKKLLTRYPERFDQQLSVDKDESKE